MTHFPRRTLDSYGTTCRILDVTLDDIAAGITVTDEQVDEGVPEVDAAGDGEGLADRLARYDDTLPCTPAAAATVLETYSAGTSVEACAREAGVAPVTAAKVLHRCGEPGVCPLAPAARDVVRDWLDGRISRAEAETLTRADDAEFALAVYVETHDPHPGLEAAAEGALAPSGDASVDKLSHLDATMSSVEDLL
jgi:hypothetical protein